jgi:hypothetical protein
VTLVLDCFARDAAFQVSDRRLVDPERGTIVDDETNKAVILNGRVVFSYTRLAKIRGQRTDEWLARAVYGRGCASLTRQSNGSISKDWVPFSA